MTGTTASKAAAAGTMILPLALAQFIASGMSWAAALRKLRRAS